MAACSSGDAILNYNADAGVAGNGQCLGKSNGTECGAGRICVAEACLSPICGDGVIKSDDEECDDGNTVDDDGCSNECLRSVCGNGYLEPYEACDDFNTADGDGCPSSCRGPVCGNREPEAPEVCDGPQAGLSGVSQSYSCNADCTEKLPYACESCQNLHCTAYLSRTQKAVNAVSGCLQAVDTTHGANAADPTFLQECVDLVNCALKNRCGIDGGYASIGCYCGITSDEDCAKTGPAEQGPCHAEFVAAARVDSPAEIYTRMTDFAHPVAWASALLDCYRDKCADTCAPY